MFISCFIVGIGRADDGVSCDCLQACDPYCDPNADILDDCFETLEPSELPPPTLKAAPAPRPPVARGSVLWDQAAKTVRYTIELTQVGIERYTRITDISINVVATFKSNGEIVVGPYPFPGVFHGEHFVIAADGHSAYLSLKYRRNLELPRGSTAHAEFIPIVENLEVRTERTGETLIPLYGRRGRARSRAQVVDE